VSDRNPEDLTDLPLDGERRVNLFDSDVEVLTAILELAVLQHRARQQTGLEQDLKPIADSEHRSAARGELSDRRHDR